MGIDSGIVTCFATVVCVLNYHTSFGIINIMV